MCKIFGTEFTQYLPLVMPSVMKAASIKPEVAVVDGWYQNIYFFNLLIVLLLRVHVFISGSRSEKVLVPFSFGRYAIPN